jgi:hypothetical protein
VDGAYQASGSQVHDIECAFLVELYVVNRAPEPISIQRIEGEAEIGGARRLLKVLESLSDFQIEFPTELIDNPSWIGGQKPRIAELTPNLAEELRKPLQRGIAKQGWIRFGVEMSSQHLTDKIQYRISLVDALDVKHPVTMDVCLPGDAKITYNPSVWKDWLSGN